MYGDVSKVVFIANDITKEKQMEFESFRTKMNNFELQEEKLRLGRRRTNKKAERSQRRNETPV